MTDMGRKGAEILIALAEGRLNGAELEDVVFRPELIIRQSCAPPGQG